MRKWIAILLVLAMSVTLTGCEDLSEVLAFCGELGELLSAISTMPLEDLEEGLGELVDMIPTDPTDETDPTEVKDPEEDPTEAKDHEEDPTEDPGNKDPQLDPSEVQPGPGGSDTALTELEALWEQLHGCWVGDEDRYVFFTYLDEGPGFRSGTWSQDVPYGRDAATVTALTNLGSGLYTLNITYPPVSGDARDSQDLREISYTLAVDISGLDNGVVRVEAPEDTWRDYSWAGYSYDDAWEAQNQVVYASFEEMQEFWTWLVGYWNSDDGRFICFDQMDSNTLVLMEGVWDSGSRGWGYFEKAMSGDMDLPMEFVIYYPPVSNQLDGDLPSKYVRVIVDWMEVETHGRIYVKMGENAPWIMYTFAGYSEADAYPN